MAETATFDLAVAGSGAAGLAAAITAAHLGLDVVVIEKERQLGGTSAWSGGWMWVPRNPLAVAAGIIEPIDAAKTYLMAELGNGYDDALVSTFLEHAPLMVAFFSAHTALQFVDGNRVPDFHDTSPGAALGGRSVCAAPFDARRLGARVHDLRPPLGEVAPFGMGIAAGADLKHFLFATRAWPSFLHAARRVGRHLFERALHGRGRHLVSGNALVAALLKTADDLGIRIMTGMRVSGLLERDGAVCGLKAVDEHGEIEMRTRRGVVLATGGFPHDRVRKSEMFPHAPTGQEHFSAAPASNTGDGLRLGESVGGFVRRDLSNAGAWAPVSLVPHRNGSVGRFPHLVERAKPGLIMVRRDGRRFVNEADSYHDVMQALLAATPKGEPVEAWLICDTTFRRRYGLGRVRPLPFAITPWLRNGYLMRGATLEALARATGIDTAGLAATIAAVNRDAEDGRDSAFGRGSSPYNKAQGEAGSGPNPCVAPIVRAPFYAVKVVAGSLGTFAGLKTDASARVLDGRGAPIAGLYAVGNDMSSLMAGRYPAGGITLGPGMTFGYIAAHHASGVALDTVPVQSRRAGAETKA